MDYLLNIFTPNDFDYKRNPFQNDNSIIQHKICGHDLRILAEKLNFSVIDSAWFFGTTIAAWYEYTTDPTDKIKLKFQKKIDKVNSKRSKVLEKLSSGPDDNLYTNLHNLDGQIKSLSIEQEKTLLRQHSQAGKRSIHLPVELPLALLYRVVHAMPFIIRSVSLTAPDIHLFKSLIDRNQTHSEFSSYLGRDANAGYRWLKDINPPSPTIKRLMYALLLWFHMGDEDHIDERVSWWISVVENEHRLLGRELGKGVPRTLTQPVKNDEIGL